jgi:hypothetical protein
LPSLDGFYTAAQLTGRAPYCLDCCEKIGFRHFKKWETFQYLSPHQARKWVILYLLSLCTEEEQRLVCDHFQICRCCCEPEARVESPAKRCDACRDIQCCESCEVFRTTLFYKYGTMICVTCLKKNRDNYKPERSFRAWKGLGCKQVRVDRQAGVLDPGFKCIRSGCSGTVARFGAPHCSAACKDLHKSSPGELCSNCWIRPRTSEKHKWCDECQEDDGFKLRSRQ